MRLSVAGSSMPTTSFYGPLAPAQPPPRRYACDAAVGMANGALPAGVVGPLSSHGKAAACPSKPCPGCSLARYGAEKSHG